MIAAEITMGVLLHQYFGGKVGDTVPYGVGVGIIAVVCIFVAGFAWSWGPLAWLVSHLRHPSHIHEGVVIYM